jgi:hypothetical protein
MKEQARVRPIIISMTAIPPRFPNLPRKVASLINQSVKADAIEIYIPRKYKRFSHISAELPPLPPEVRIVHVNNDYGPATKLLPALERYRNEDVDILLCDDDKLQDRRWVERLSKCRLSRPNDIICEKGWNIKEMLQIEPKIKFTPRAQLSPKKGKTVGYKILRAMGLGFFHPNCKRYQHPGYIDIFAGFSGALVKSGSLPNDAWDIPEIIWTVDDVWLSGMAAKNGVGIWVHAEPRPIYRDTKWDKKEALKNFEYEGADREKANRMCVEYMREKYNIW